MREEGVMQEIPESKARGRILAYIAPPPEFIKASLLHMGSALMDLIHRIEGWEGL